MKNQNVNRWRKFGIRRALFALAASLPMLGWSAKYDVAAFVWPAYHPAERWAELGIFGDGKGEWQNVYEATKRFDEDRIGVKPLWGYESESDPVAVARKIDAAVSSGVNVFIYDWYWYGGRPFLEEALDRGFLGARNNQRMQFYIMYANHDVNGLWNNRLEGAAKNKLIWSAKITDNDWREIVRRWIGYFKKPNYYTVNGKPAIMIYDIAGFVKWEGVEKARSRLDYLRSETKRAGFPGLHLQIVGTAYFPNDPSCFKTEVGADAMTAYNWRFATASRIEDKTQPMLTYGEWGEMSVRAWDKAKRDAGELKMTAFPNLSVGWDTNSRYPKSVSRNIVSKANPQDFERFARAAREWVDRNLGADQPKLITINSWNEWTEGSYLEPDEEFGYGYLDALRKVFVEEVK